MNPKQTGATGSSQRDRRMLLSGVFVLTVANLLVKLCGLIYKVPMNAMLGDEMVNVNAAHSIYNILYMISTAGVPVAVSVLVSECRASGDVLRLRRVFRVSLFSLLAIGALGTLLMWGTAGMISDINSGGESYYCILAIAPSLLFISVCSVYRGYYQGFQQMTPTAVSEILESFGKMAFGLVIIYASLNFWGQSTSTAAALSVLSMGIGIILGMVYLVFAKRRYEKKDKLVLFGDAVANLQETDKSAVLPRLASIAIPISLSAVVLNLASLVDSQLMFPLLTKVLGDRDLARAVSSDYTTGAVTLYNLPGILVYPVSCSIVPFISAARASGDKTSVRRVMNSSLRITALVSLPCALGMSALSGPILSLVFGSGDPAMAGNAGPLLRVLAMSVFFVAMLSVTNALLQAHNQEKKPMISMAVGLGVKIVSDVILTNLFGAIGAPLSTVLFHMTVVSLNFYFVVKYTDVVPSFGAVFFRPFLASVFSSVMAIVLYGLLASRIGANLSTLIAMGGAAVVYLLAIFFLRCITEEDVLLLPKGEKVARVLRRLHFIK